jgi:outer membrane protein OmpA-like peptidoglycan-associated protein
VIGHTDTVGGVEDNDELSLQRAERVKADLVAQGIPADRIRAAGRGEREPVVPTVDNVDEPRNRRVEINVR